MPSPRPTIYLIASCNGAGKTTFAKEFLPKEVKCLRFLNADEIARGLSPLKLSASAIQSGRLFARRGGRSSTRSSSFPRVPAGEAAATRFRTRILLLNSHGNQ